MPQLSHLAMLAAVATAGLFFLPAASAQMAPTIQNIPADKAPPVPAGLKITCLTGADSLTSSQTCPVVVYDGVTTWAFSFVDNRLSFELVSYDASNAVIRATKIDGARYVWQITSDEAGQTITVYGQGNDSVSAPWSQFGP